jgi:hypothetical protein
MYTSKKEVIIRYTGKEKPRWEINISGENIKRLIHEQTTTELCGLQIKMVVQNKVNYAAKIVGLLLKRTEANTVQYK